MGDSPIPSLPRQGRAEVDIVLERGAGEVAGVEVKAGATVTSADCGLRKLKDGSGKRFSTGIVLYDGETTVSFGGGSTPCQSPSSG